MSAHQEEPCITLETKWCKNDNKKEVIKQKFEETIETIQKDPNNPLKETQTYAKISAMVRDVFFRVTRASAHLDTSRIARKF